MSQCPLAYATEFEDTSDIDALFPEGEWHWVDVPVEALIAAWFREPGRDQAVRAWWRSCRREDGSSDRLLSELMAGEPLREPVVLTLGGMEYNGETRLGIADGCHRIAACYLAGVPTIRAAVGVFQDAAPDFVARFDVPPAAPRPRGP